MITPRAGPAARPWSDFLEPPDPIAELGGLFVGLGDDRLLQVLAKPGQLLGPDLLRRPAGRLSSMPGGPVDALQERKEFGQKSLVIVRAPESARVSEVHKL